MLTVWLPLPNYRLQFGGVETGVKTDTTGSYSLELPGFGVKQLHERFEPWWTSRIRKAFPEHRIQIGFNLELELLQSVFIL